MRYRLKTIPQLKPLLLSISEISTKHTQLKKSKKNLTLSDPSNHMIQLKTMNKETAK